ncbi:hypothetical protein FGADI_5233 [Fusarium gaditjirri]|uniref:Uncharacterized protein n=1 Tax=Fusarium gaditjirri TaxID=282569 RepID=A0A8H4WYE3_9HYPO|nr:hypothetical protein FGADI_5233 [Fusarium gaditjirri]
MNKDGDKTALYGNELAELIAQDVSNPIPADNTVNARLANIDGTRTAVLTCQLYVPEDSKRCGGFGLIFKDDSKHDDFDTLEFVKSNALKLNGIINTPSALINAPDDLVEMKKLATGPGTSRAYFSDYLVKKFDEGGHRSYARFDHSLTWNNSTCNTSESKRGNFQSSSLSSTATNTFLDCHRAALQHSTMPLRQGLVPTQSYLAFFNSIVP